MNNMQKHFKQKAQAGMRAANPIQKMQLGSAPHMPSGKPARMASGLAQHFANGGLVADALGSGLAAQAARGMRASMQAPADPVAQPAAPMSQGALGLSGIRDGAMPPASILAAQRAGMANGGVVTGPGGPTEDKVPAQLSPGEYVLPADTVNAVGAHNLDGLRAATHVPTAPNAPLHFANGGQIPGSILSDDNGSFAAGGNAPAPVLAPVAPPVAQGIRPAAPAPVASPVPQVATAPAAPAPAPGNPSNAAWNAMVDRSTAPAAPAAAQGAGLGGWLAKQKAQSDAEFSPSNPVNSAAVQNPWGDIPFVGLGAKGAGAAVGAVENAAPGLASKALGWAKNASGGVADFASAHNPFAGKAAGAVVPAAVPAAEAAAQATAPLVQATTTKVPGTGLMTVPNWRAPNAPLAAIEPIAAAQPMRWSGTRVAGGVGLPTKGSIGGIMGLNGAVGPNGYFGQDATAGADAATVANTALAAPTDSATDAAARALPEGIRAANGQLSTDALNALDSDSTGAHAWANTPAGVAAANARFAANGMGTITKSVDAQGRVSYTNTATNPYMDSTFSNGQTGAAIMAARQQGDKENLGIAQAAQAASKQTAQAASVQAQRAQLQAAAAAAVPLGRWANENAQNALSQFETGQRNAAEIASREATARMGLQATINQRQMEIERNNRLDARDVKNDGITQAREQTAQDQARTVAGNSMLNTQLAKLFPNADPTKTGGDTSKVADAIAAVTAELGAQQKSYADTPKNSPDYAANKAKAQRIARLGVGALEPDDYAKLQSQLWIRQRAKDTNGMGIAPGSSEFHDSPLSGFALDYYEGDTAVLKNKTRMPIAQLQRSKPANDWGWDFNSSNPTTTAANAGLGAARKQ